MADQEPRSLIQAACWALFAPGQVVEHRPQRGGHVTAGETPPGQRVVNTFDWTDFAVSGRFPAGTTQVTVVFYAEQPSTLKKGLNIDNVLLQEVDDHDLAAAVGEAGPALAAASCNDVAAALPGGLASPVGESGSRLSGGQRQRVGLARVLHAAPEVLVLVDPTTGVDSVTEQRVAAAVGDLRAGATTVILSASPAWEARADRVVDLRRRSR